MRMRKNEIAYLQLKLGNPYPEFVRATVTEDNRWRIHPEDIPDDDIREIMQNFLRLDAEFNDDAMYLPHPYLKWPTAIIQAHPGSQLVTWRGKKEYERQMRENPGAVY